VGEEVAKEDTQVTKETDSHPGYDHSVPLCAAPS
jgi:hypothetical protein